jgi:hypothetical protein
LAVPATCARGASYCDTFDDPGSGWPSVNGDSYHAFYTNGGTYRIGETGNAVTSVTSPQDIAFTQSYSVRADVDVTAKELPAGGSFGVECYRRAIPGSDGKYSGIDLRIGAQRAEVVLLDESTGAEHPLAHSALPTTLEPGRTTHATFDCARTGTGVDLTVWLRTTPLLHLRYAGSRAHWPWQWTNDIALETAGPGTDVIFDNFALTSLCRYVSARPGGC